MRLCYIDESGDTAALPSATANMQPAIVIGCVMLEHRQVGALIADFIALKRRFFPGLMPQGTLQLDWILAEVKGADLRRDAVSGSHRQRRGAIGFIDAVIDLMEKYQLRLSARIWIKGIAVPIDGVALYTSSVQALCADFQHHLTSVDDVGGVIADSRTKVQNANVSHSIFTRKFRAMGDDYDRIVEMPAFGHSDNHAGLQVADALCSALLFPLAMDAYCSGYITNVHVRPGYHPLRRRWIDRLKLLQHRYQDNGGSWRGGFTVSDTLQHRPSSVFFQV